MGKLFNKSVGIKVFGLFLGRIMCLPEVDAYGVHAPGKPFSILLKTLKIKGKKCVNNKREKNLHENKSEISGEIKLAWFYF